MSGRPGNPALVKGTSGNPSGKSKGALTAARSLALACREAASDEEIAEWLLEIASGRWPEIRQAPKKANPDNLPSLDTSSPPSGEQRMAALKEFLLRRDGQPMQAVVLKADIEARARRIENASDAIDVGEIDPTMAAAFEVMLIRALGAPTSPQADLENTQPVIDVASVEVKQP